MTLKVGDSYFNRQGFPGVVKGRDDQTDTVIVEKEGPAYEKARRYGFINGMIPEHRQEFESIIDNMRTKPESAERVSFLQEQIDTIRQDPRRMNLARYLEGEMAHIMNTEHINPRVYRVDPTKI